MGVPPLTSSTPRRRISLRCFIRDQFVRPVMTRIDRRPPQDTPKPRGLVQCTHVKASSAPAARSSASSGISNVRLCRSASAKSLRVSMAHTGNASQQSRRENEQNRRLCLSAPNNAGHTRLPEPASSGLSNRRAGVTRVVPEPRQRKGTPGPIPLSYTRAPGLGTNWVMGKISSSKCKDPATAAGSGGQSLDLSVPLVTARGRWTAICQHRGAMD
jgi:hypothetical protein